MAPYHVSPAVADAVHTALPLGLVGVGVAYAAQPLEWLRAFGSLFAVIALVLLGGAGAVDVLCSGLPSCRRLQSHKSAARQRLAEAFETTRAAWVFASLAAWPAYAVRLGVPTALMFTLEDAQPEAPSSLALYACKVALVTLGVDAYMYFKHRLLHTRALWAFHAGHHAFHDPSPFASFAVQPVEALLTFWPVVLLVLPAARVWAQAYSVWVAGFVLLNLYLHAGHESAAVEAVLRPLGLNSSAFHNAHHAKSARNFGELMYVWDWALGTGEHPKEGPQQ